jgi:hypothetical protein
MTCTATSTPATARTGALFPQETAQASTEHSGQHQHGCGDQDRILVHAIEDVRRQQCREDAAEHAAERDPKIELGKADRRRPPAIELAMAEQRQQHERYEIEADHGQPEQFAAAEETDRQRRHRDRRKPRDHLLPDPGPVRGNTATKVRR